MATSKIFFQDDSIQLIETASSQENISNIESSPSILKLKRKNKIHSPPPLSPSISLASSNDVSDLFKAKQVRKLPPVPKPRTIKPRPSDREPKGARVAETTFSETRSGQSPRSDTISYKEQLRNRFLSVKKQAGSSVSQTPVRKATRKKRHSIDKGLLVQENEAIDQEINKRQSKSRDINNGFEFFCEQKDNDKEEDKNVGEEEKETKEEIEEPEETEKDSIVEFLGLDIRDTEVVESIRGHKINIAENEKEIFWRPSGSVKIDQSETRCLEEEGIYTADEPNIPTKQLNKLKENLLMDEDRDWFEPDGRLRILPDPRLNKCFKPFKSDTDPNLTQGLDTINVLPKIYEPLDFTEDFNTDNIFEIQLNSIKFKHHALFSPEHVLSQKLTSLYEKFLQKKTVNKCTMLQKNLEALISARTRLQNNLLGSGDNPNQRINKYQQEIKEVRKNMYEEGKSYRELIKWLLHTWKSLKIVRDDQKYVNTPLKLMIKKEYDVYQTEKEKWEKNIEEEVSDIILEHENEFQDELKKFKAELKEWKAKKRSMSEENEDELPEKPRKPQRKFNVEQTTLEVTEKCEQCLKHPGEPILDFELVIDKELITKDVVNPKELLRRSQINKTQIYAKIMFNKQEVCKSKTITLTNDFICEFNEAFSIKMISKPKNFTLDIYEQSGNLNKRLLHQIHLLESKNDEDSKEERFLKKEKIHLNHTGVGSEVNTKNIFKTFNIEIVDDELYTNGTIMWNNSWILSDNNDLVTESKLNITTRLLNINNITNLSKTFIDPQDPQNSMIYEYIKNIDESHTQDYFRIEPEMKFLEFCEASELDNNPRFKMLQLRDRNEPEFQGIAVPNRIKEIPEDVFDAYEKRCAENKGTVLLEEFAKEDIDGQRKWGIKFWQRAENKVIQLSKAAENKISLQDVITEDAIPTLGSLGLSFMNWLQPNRPLRPTRKVPKHSTTVVSTKDAKIIINIVGAIQVPVRKDTDMIKTNEQMATIPVRPFVIATFKDQQARTTVAEGANPIWNQELTLPLEDLSETSLQNLKGSLHLNLYDETVCDLTEDDRLRHTNIHQQLGYDWLGGISLPISTLLYNKRIEGTFKINSPSMLLGYENNLTQFYTDTISHRQDTYLTIFVTMQPTIERIRKIQPCLECNEMEYVEEHIKIWAEEYKILFPNRHFSSLVANMNGELSCVTRYFKPIMPPSMDPEMDITEEQCARFVSMIPFRENTLCYKMPTIWLTAEQLLTLTLGSITDHAILLVCFLMAIEVKCWLVLGYGIPHGNTSYVLTTEKNSFGNNVYYVYDVETAFKYSIQDNFCPLQKVYCVINDENVWGNIQLEDRAHMTKFDLSRSSDWMPLFGRNVSAPIVAQQKLSMTFIETPTVLLLQEKIEKKIRQKIMKWRKHSITIWNHYCCSVLKQMLPSLEFNSLLPDNFRRSAKDFDELHGLCNSYKMRGFAINLPYTTIKQIYSSVRATRIHCNENPNTEFAVGVYVHPYNNYTLVVWIYLATIIRRR